MKSFAYIFLVGIGLAALLSALWRAISRRYQLPCPVWLSWMVELDNPFTKSNRAKSILDHLQLEPRMNVLDAGCGPGRLAIPIARQIGDQGRLVAMDIQDGMIARTRAKAHAEGLTNIEFLNAGLGHGSLEKNRFDRALLVTVLGEIPGKVEALKEIFDALKAGGILSITEVFFDPHFQSRRTVSRLAVKAGFAEQETFGNRMAFTMNLQKPAQGKKETPS